MAVKLASSRSRSSALPPLPCVCATLRRATRAVTKFYDDLFRLAGLRATQYTLLHALSVMGATTQGRLGRILALDSTTLSRTLKPLEDQGWVHSVPGRDRRERYLDLTAEGKRQLARACVHWEEAQERLRKAIGEEQWDELQRVLDVVAKAAREA